MFDFIKKIRTAKPKKIKNMAGANYKVIDSPDALQCDQGIAEYKNENEILTLTKRLKLLDMARNAVRNNPSINAILNNFVNACIGADGFKLIYTGEENEETIKLKHLFRKWARECEFFDRTICFRDFLGILLKALIIQGDLTVVFDDNLIKGSGRVLLFESDEQGNIDKESLEEIYGKGCYQIDGRVFNQYSEYVGIVLSKSQRGKEIYDVDRSYCLKMNPDESYFNASFFQPALRWRICERGQSPLIPAIGCAENLEDVINSEIATTKKSARLLAQIYDTKNTTDESIPSAYSEEEIQNMSKEELEAYLNTQEEYEQTVTFETIKSCATQVIQLPDGKKMEFFNPAHPSLDTLDFINKLQSRLCGCLGISQMYATYDCKENTDVQQMLSWQTFRRYQKILEQVADWIFYKFVQFQIKQGNIDASKLPSDFEFSVKWSHPTKESLDENQNQQAIAKKLQNMTGTYQDILGADWKEKLEQMKNEINWLKENNLPVPQYGMISGGEKTGADIKTTIEE